MNLIFIMTFFEILILVCACLLLYVYFIYPVIIAIAAKFFEKPVHTSLNFTPEVVIIIAAYNEENYIEDCIKSIYNSDYPAEKIKVIVGSDGSSDDTVAKLKNLKVLYPTLDYYEFNRIGKNKVINELIKFSDTDLIFFLDADCRLERKALASVVSKFNDNNVGAVLASLKVAGIEEKNDTGKIGETFYQRYETTIRINESKLHSNINALGTLYGIRRDKYMHLPNDLVCDDFYNILFVSLKGKRAIYDESAIVFEVRPSSLKDEFRRRIRIIACILSTIYSLKELLKPKYGWVAFCLWSHKLLRSFSPIYLLVILFSTFFLEANSVVWLVAVIIQSLLYVGALIGYLLERIKIHFIIFRILLFYVSMNIGLLIGLFRFFIKQQNAMWERIDTRF